MRKKIIRINLHQNKKWLLSFIGIYSILLFGYIQVDFFQQPTNYVQFLGSFQERIVFSAILGPGYFLFLSLVLKWPSFQELIRYQEKSDIWRVNTWLVLISAVFFSIGVLVLSTIVYLTQDISFGVKNGGLVVGFLLIMWILVTCSLLFSGLLYLVFFMLTQKNAIVSSVLIVLFLLIGLSNGNWAVKINSWYLFSVQNEIDLYSLLLYLVRWSSFCLLFWRVAGYFCDRYECI